MIYIGKILLRKIGIRLARALRRASNDTAINMSNGKRTKVLANRKKTMRQAMCACTLILPLLGVTTGSVKAKGAYVPYTQSLEAMQQRAYVNAAPQGQDVAREPGKDVVFAPLPTLPQEDSRLEQIAAKQKGALTLDETQQAQELASELEQFGYDIFNRAPSVLSAGDGIPVPEGYRIGPGDNIIVQLFGKRNVEYKLVVTRDGNILVPEYGPVKIAGLSFDEAEKLLVEGFERRAIGAKAVVTMGRLRTLQIRLAGDVVQPGIYKVGGLSSLLDALLTTGGVRRTGSLRNIKLIRGDESIASLDLYDLLQRGSSRADIFLKHNDTIFVPPIGEVVSIGGDVQRPAIYELSGERTVEQVIEMAGGLLPTASLAHSLIERIQNNGFRTLVDFSAMAASGNKKGILQTRISNGDFLRILPLEDELEDVVLVSGHVKRPGGFQFRTGMRISDVFPSVDLLLPAADVDFLLVKREQSSTLRTEIAYTRLIDAIANPGGDADIILQARDHLMVFSLAEQRDLAVEDIVLELDVQGTDYRPARVIEVRGAVRYGGRLPLQEGARLLDVVGMAGGLKPGAEAFYGVIARTRSRSRDITIVPFAIAAAMTDPAGEKNLVIEPGDRLYFFDDEQDRSMLMAQEIKRLREQARYGADERLVSILGEVLHRGEYPLTKSMRASDLVCAASGLSRKAYALGAELSRVKRNTGHESSVNHMTLDSVGLLKICEAQRRMASGELDTAASAELFSRYQNEQLNPLLEPMDQLTFSEKPGWVDRSTVTLRGELQRPGTYAINRGETLCEVLVRAGGLSADAYSFGAEFTRQSVREMQQKTLDELHDQLDDLMVDLSLSHSFNNEEKTSLEWAGKQDYLKSIQQLERGQATGRLVIDMNAVQKCHQHNNPVLQNGDILTVPRTPDFVQVSGQVYVPTSHLYNENRKISDYVELSGGNTVLGRLKDAYVVQANGEVLNYRGSRTSSRIASKKVMPGARIYVPINVDRMNGTERAQSWLSSLMQSAILAGIVL